MLQLPAVAICLYVAIGLVFNSTVRAQSAHPADALAVFSKQDNAGAWIKDRNYMRDQQDETWKVRMRTLQSLVDAGEESIPPLLDALKNGDDETRVFAAQTLGYLAPNVPREPLLEAATNDPLDAVRLYAIDALGMQGGKDLADDLKPLLKTEKNRDVKKHIGYALERGNQGLEESVIDDLLNWDADTIDSAEIGKPAPDFTMLTGDGERVRLSDYRGKKAVVVVFVYGDT